MRKITVLIVLCIYCSAIFATSSFLYNDQKLYTGSSCRSADGRNGFCAVNCSTLTNDQLLDRRNICAFLKSTPLLCCPRTVVDSVGPYPTLSQACVDRKEKAKEEIRTTTEFNQRSANQLQQRNSFEPLRKEYLPPSSSQWQCEQEGRKIGGFSKVTPVVINEHPHVAALAWKDTNGTVTWRCGGVLVHMSFVVTAAHCIFFFGKPYLVRVGDMHLLQKWDDKYAVDYDVEEVFNHPKYEPPKFYHSVALLKLKKREEFRYKQSPLPACIWTENNVPTTRLLTMGYGAPGFGHRHLARRFQSYLTVLPHSECVKLYDPIVDMPRGIIDTQICALDEADILDTCVGDFGGPLQFTTADVLKTPYLVGITTFGVQCLDGNPGVYLRLYNYLDWIEKTIKDNN